MKRLILVVFILFTGCVTLFSRIEQPHYQDSDNLYSAILPVGWVKSSLPQHNKQLVITKDGFGVQSIIIKSPQLADAYPKLKKAAKEDMSLSDLADNELAEFKVSHQSAPSVKVIDNQLSAVNGHKAFKLHYNYLNEKGLRIDRLTYGFANRGVYYTLSYEAPWLHFYNRDIPVFEQVVSSFKVQG